MIFTISSPHSNKQNNLAQDCDELSAVESPKENAPMLQKIVDAVLLIGTASLTIVSGQAIFRFLQVYFIEKPGYQKSPWANFLVMIAVVAFSILVVAFGLSSLLDGGAGGGESNVRGCTNWDKVAQKIGYHVERARHRGPNDPKDHGSSNNIDLKS